MADKTLAQVAYEAHAQHMGAWRRWQDLRPFEHDAWEAAASATAEAERERIMVLLRRAAAGRREYAGHEDDGSEARPILLKSAEHYESAVWLMEDPRNMLDVMPSWMWTDEEQALLREQP